MGNTCGVCIDKSPWPVWSYISISFISYSLFLFSLLLFYISL
jgi:hypothetical protein